MNSTDERTHEKIEPPYEIIADGLKAGTVVPFFGAAASAVYRPEGETWEPGKPFMPFGVELAKNLARMANYRGEDEEYPNLAFVASWVEHCQGTRRDVNNRLRRCFVVDAEPGNLHATLSSLDRLRLYVTTNYDDMLERALAPRRPHVVIDRGEKQGLWARIAGGPLEKVRVDLRRLIADATTGEPSAPIVFKMHGSVSRESDKDDSYLITEEDYVDFLGKAQGKYLPPYIQQMLQGRTLLFLGYSLEDWNVRVILRKLLRATAGGEVRFYAIAQGRSARAQSIWQAQNLNIYPMDLRRFADTLAGYL